MKLNRYILALAASLSIGLALSSCDKPEIENPGNGDITTDSNIVYLEAGEGSTASVTIKFDSDWTTAQTPEWLEVSPSEGKAGEVTLTLTATASNTEMAEKISEVTLTSLDNSTTIYALQHGPEGIVLLSEEPSIKGDTLATMLVKTKSGSNITVESDGSWVSVLDLVRTDTPADTIPGTKIPSEYAEFELSLKMEENPSYFEYREGTITVKSGEFSFSFDVEQDKKDMLPVFLGPESGSAHTMTVAGEDISASTDTGWITVANEGTNVTITATSANTEMAERDGYVTIKDGSKTARLTVIQNGIDGIILLDGNTSYTATREIDINVRCNSNADITIESTDNSVSLKELRANGTAEEIGDSNIDSQYNDYTMVLEITENPSDDSRRNISATISAGNDSFGIQIEQLEGRLANKKFYRMGVGFYFTATTCGYCPNMGKAFNAAYEEHPDRFIPLSVHCGGTLGWEYAGDFMTTYKVSGTPTGVFNACADVPNYQSNYTSITSLIGRLTEEMVQYNYAVTGISAEASVTGNTLHLDAEITAIAADEYTIAAYIVESGIVAAQTDYSINGTDEDYVHNFVIRKNISSPEGDLYSFQTGETKPVSFSTEIPSNVNRDNAYIVIYVIRPGEQRVTDVKTDYIGTGHYIDNAIIVGSLEGTTPLRYEE